MTVPDHEVERILRSLGLAVTSVPAGWDVLAPTFRVDLLREVDLIEEVGRHYGFDRLEPSFPPMAMAAPAPDARLERDHIVRRTLTAAGLSEAITFGIIESAAVAAFAAPAANPGFVPVANPLSAKFDMLRPTLLPGLVDAVAHNRRHGRRDVALFEVGARFTVDGERHAVALAWTGSAASEHWSVAAARSGLLRRERRGRAAGPGARRRCRASSAIQQAFLVDGQAAVVLAGDRRLGIVGQLAPDVIEHRGAPRMDKVFVAELDLDAIAALARPRDVHRPRAAALPDGRSRSLDRRVCEPCLRKSFVAPFTPLPIRPAPTPHRSHRWPSSTAIKARESRTVR